MEAEKQGILVLIGATPKGRKERIDFQTGFRKSTQSWTELLTDLKSRGLSVAPELAIGDGALGGWKALEEQFGATRHQRLSKGSSSPAALKRVLITPLPEQVPSPTFQHRFGSALGRTDRKGGSHGSNLRWWSLEIVGWFG